MQGTSESSSGLYSPSSGYSGRTAKSGFLYKVDVKAMGLVARRKYWFALSESSHYLYWFKDPNDVSCVGRLPLKGAAFTYTPMVKGRFEIYAGSVVYTLEADCQKMRDEWLDALQRSRKINPAEPTPVNEASDIISLSSNQEDGSQQGQEGEVTESVPESQEEFNGSQKELTGSQKELLTLLGPRSSSNSQETLSDDPNRESPPASTSCVPRFSEHGELFSSTPSSTFYLNTDGQLNEKSMEMPNEQTGQSAFRKLSERAIDYRYAKKSKQSPPGLTECIKCRETEKLEDNCRDLEDQINSFEQMVKVLKTGLYSAQRQVETMKEMEKFNCDNDTRDFLLEKEDQLTKLQLENNALNRRIQMLEAENSDMDAKITDLSSSVEAFRDSVRTKEELIMRYVEKGNLEENATQTFEEVEVPEGILIDQESGLRCDEEAQQVFETVGVRDINELKDSVEGYKTQNRFLSNEVVALHGEIEKLLKTDRNLNRKNFDVEACYYQLKSRYLMVLNHFKSPEKPGKIMEPGVLRQLLEEANRTPIQTKQTDTLGFYLKDRTTDGEEKNDDLLENAAQYMNKANGIVEARQLEQSEEHIKWLQSWDALLVNFVGRLLPHSTDLKNLVRTGIPHTYRRRVWKNLVTISVKDQQVELGNGYYESLLRKAKAKVEEGNFDSAIKQIDLDLARTLPTNKYFDDPESSKIEMLRRVLYALRYHNGAVGYCQGLNRLAAIALICLDDEEDSFWFMVACVEHLQPDGYYTSTLIGAVADQKVLRDLVAEKLPKLAAHLRNLEVDLSLFALGWFMTCFVDALPHSIYLNIFDVFLYEGNKAIFRFALALLKIAEPNVLQCKTIGTVHASLSKVTEHVTDFKMLAQIAFNELNPFPQKQIESKRTHYLAQLKQQGYS